MTRRFVVSHGSPGGAVPVLDENPESPLLLDWFTSRHNALCDLRQLAPFAHSALSPVMRDLLDIAVAVYLADIASPRGRLEEWVRELEIEVPVRMSDFWEHAQDDLMQLLYTLTRDRIKINFSPLNENLDFLNAFDVLPEAQKQADCICLLSGGLDSFAGAAMLTHTGRKPLFISHQSGNPTVEISQRAVLNAVGNLSEDEPNWAAIRVMPGVFTTDSLSYPAAEQRESSRRARSFLFMTLGAVAAQMIGSNEVYLCENGILTAALPLTPARSGSLSTRSTHPHAIHLFTGILSQADVPCDVLNPFLYQTKGDVVRTFLKPLLAPADIMSSISCWAAGRQNRQCGGCIPCLLRRIALLSAGLPDEAYMMDLLGTPEEYRGTDAYGNLIDLLTQAATLLESTELDLLLEYPQLLDLDAAGVDVSDAVKTLKRHAAEVFKVVQEHFPAAAQIMGRARF